MMDTLEKPTVDTDISELFKPEYDDSDSTNDTRTHIVNPPANQHIWQLGMTMQEVVDIARNTGDTVTALCGYTWVPKRNPERYPACEECMRIAGELMAGAGE